MKAISAALKGHLAQPSTTLATILKVTRTDGQSFGFTDYSNDIEFEGLVYQAAVGHTPSNVKTNSQLNVDNLEITTTVDFSAIDDMDALAGLWDYAEVVISTINYADLSQGKMYLRRGWMGQMKFGRQEVTAELRGMMQPLQQIIGRIYSLACDADLGDNRCKVNLPAFTVTGAITAVASTRQFTDSGRTESARWFEGGVLTWLTGANATYKMEVKSFASGVITLQQPMINDVAVGDTYSMSAGCDKTLPSCRDKFNNVINHQGFPHIPGQDRYISGT
jgi:uncharacterized phage protein (TIGR02218 family)